MIILIDQDRDIYLDFQKSIKNLKAFGDLFLKDTQITKDCLLEEMRMYEDAIKLLQNTKNKIKRNIEIVNANNKNKLNSISLYD